MAMTGAIRKQIRGSRAASSRRHEQRAMDVLRQFRLVYGSVRSHSRRIEQDCGMSGSQAWILHELRRSPDIGVSELAARLSIHVSTASQLVEKLVQTGYVTKQRNVEDQRRVGLRLTHEGSAALRRIPHPAAGLLPSALMDLSDAALRTLQRSLQALIAGIQPLDAEDAEWPVMTDADRP